VVDRVKADLSKRNLILTPSLDGMAADDSSASEFEVTVTNDSQYFASFQLELSTAGIATDAIEGWYQIEPEICTKKPPGASTTFKVAILRSPMPVYDTTIDLLLRVFSVEFRQLHTTQKLNLAVKKPLQPLNLVLPNKYFKALPGDAIDIVVLVYNHSSNAVKATLCCADLNSEWLIPGNEKVIRVESSYPTKVTFTCQLPNSPELLRQTVPFRIEALSEIKGHIPSVEGIVEVLPSGKIEFNCSPKLIRIPAKDRLFTRKVDQTATYNIELKNSSNSTQRVVFSATDFDHQHYGLVLPEPTSLEPNESRLLPLISRTARHWVGFKRLLRFAVNADVEDLTAESSKGDRRIRVVPPQQIMELEVLPIIPPWLLLLGGGLLVALLWFLWLLNPGASHQEPVNSVRFDGNASTVFSGSNDQKVLRWQVDNDPFQVPVRRLKYESDISQGQIKKAVRVIRVSPTDNNTVVAGLENGDIQLLDVLGNKRTFSLFKGTDRVFTLDFSQDARYLFSGHGSSRIRQWDFQTKQQVPLRTIVTNFAISSLAINQTSMETLAAVAGRFNKLLLWDWSSRIIYEIPYRIQLDSNQSSTLKFSPVFGQHHYIESVVITNELLVTADNQGFITIWNLRDRACQLFPKSDIQVLERIQNRLPTLLRTGECELKILDQWTNGHQGKAIRSIAITEDDAYLASAGDDGRVKVWFLQDGKRSPKWQNGKVLAHYPNTKLRSVDIKASRVAGDYLFVASDAPNNQVRLYRESMKLYANQ